MKKITLKLTENQAEFLLSSMGWYTSMGNDFAKHLAGEILALLREPGEGAREDP